MPAHAAKDSSHVHFVTRRLATDWADIDSLTEDDVNLQEQRFRGGAVNWVLQTYLQVRAGLATAKVTSSIGDAIHPGCVNVVHRDLLNRLSRAAKCATIVGVRADRPPFELADFEVLQNDLHIAPGRQFYIPFWPQPGLIRRDPARGSEIRKIAYMGETGTTSPWLLSDAFRQTLLAIGVELEVRRKRWADYSDVDLVLCHRREAPCMLLQKPASKLVNAWLAGSPALLGDEPAYANIRQSALDYVSIKNASDVLVAIERFRNVPGLYQQVVENGTRRSLEFTVAKTTERWLSLLLGHALPQDASIRASKTWAGQFARFARQKIHSRRFKRQYRKEIEAGKRDTMADASALADAP
jgi:hypothetical protein